MKIVSAILVCLAFTCQAQVYDAYDYTTHQYVTIDTVVNPTYGDDVEVYNYEDVYQGTVNSVRGDTLGVQDYQGYQHDLDVEYESDQYDNDWMER